MEKTLFNKDVLFEDRWQAIRDKSGNALFIKERISYDDKEKFALT